MSSAILSDGALKRRTDAAFAVFAALETATDDLRRAALVLHMEARGNGRTPDDLRRIAAQFCDRAHSCRAVAMKLGEVHSYSHL